MKHDTVVMSSGVVRHASKPRVGVIGALSLYDELFETESQDMEFQGHTYLFRRVGP